MKANELRIGNFVFDDEYKPMKVARVETQECTDFNGNDEFNVIIEHIVVDDTYKKTYVRLRVAGSETSGMVSFTNAAEAEAFRDEVLEKIDRL